MQRIAERNAETIGVALDYLPDRFRDLAACDFFCGDALFAGITTAVGAVERTSDGRSYRSVEHVLFPCHARDKRTTIVLPVRTIVPVVLHELGHVIHWALFERVGRWDAIPRLEPVTDYARRNWLEEFAEAFTAWFYPPRWIEGEGYFRWSRSNDEFFDRLMAA